MTTITRFAPSPTGYLHIGGARTALFNYLYAKHTNGKFLLRIEDTDIERSTQEAVNVILNGLKWLGLKHDEEIVYQLQNQNKHTQLAQKLLDKGLAYKCYCTKEELDKKRQDAESQNQTFFYDGKCRDIKDHIAYKDKPYVVRLKVDKSGNTSIKDSVLGTVVVENKTIDDFVILRSNSIATYMFAVVCDDHNMGITHVIRGDDHLTNTFKQYQIYKAFNWDIPTFAHLPLIHSADGKKMSKRKGAVAVDEYQNMGFLPEAIRNYLLRLGWSHKNDEIISDENAINWFDIKDINKSPARFDLAKLTSLNHHYIKECEIKRLITLTMPFIEKNLQGKVKHKHYLDYLLNGINDIKVRSKTLLELADNAMMYVLEAPFDLEENALSFLNNNQHIIQEQIKLLEQTDNYTRDNLHDIIKNHASKENIKLADAVCGIRILLCGKMVSPASIFDIMKVLQKEETLKRLKTQY